MHENNSFNPEEMRKLLKQMKQDAMISTGYADWDSLYGGLKKGELTLIAARPGMGKTSLALNIVSHVARQQAGTILVFSPHLQAQDVAIRLLTIGTGLEGRTLLDGSLSATALSDKLTEYFHSQKARIKPKSITLPSLENIEYHCRNTPDLQLLVVHHIERICKPYEQWNPALSWEKNREPKDKALRALKELAQKLQIPVLCTGYLHRSLELRKNKRPRLQDLKKAEIPEELVDQIVFLYRDRYYDPFGTEGAECIIAKSSSGNTGVLELGWDHATGIFL